MDICGYDITGKQRFFFIAGPCVIETMDRTLRLAEELKGIAERLGLFFIFKSSFDKANRSSIDSYRGPGLEEGLRVLEEVKERLGIQITADVHTVEEISSVSGVIDLLQIPAFLCRQTDLILKAGKSGRPVNVKKGQFIAPGDVSNIIDKLRHSGCNSYAVTERGYTFGYNNLVVDMRSFEIVRSLGSPVIFDATHSTQLPGGGRVSGGEREYVPILARSAVAAGIDGLFMEVHTSPDDALCDASNQYYLDKLENLLRVLIDIDDIVKG
ncbi:MAG: 3-deoxy-8-phosphooctulonate synthase [Spirochaetota bacterium]|nr:3-deoxy-8-phosphooctulonate synthase [Spirochaetota bacterium]